MSNLYLKKETIKYYMELKGIRKNIELLKMIGRELNYKDKVFDDFIKTSEGNFSKMINGKRSLNSEYIVPLEKIFGAPIAKIIDSDAYPFIKKEDVPYSKNSKYYAYKDEMDLYINELDKLCDKNGNQVIFNYDEYGKCFIDYVGEFNSVNGLMYLYKKYNIKLKWYYNSFDTKPNITTCVLKNTIALTNLVASLNDAEIFFDIYDTYNMFITNGHYADYQSLFNKKEFSEIILNNDILFNNIFTKKEYKHICSNNEKRNLRLEEYTICTINPIINRCLKYVINNLEKYKNQAKRILKFAIKHNNEVIKRLNIKDRYYPTSDLGGIYDNKGIVQDLLIYYSGENTDEEINQYLKKLPKLDKVCFVFDEKSNELLI